MILFILVDLEYKYFIRTCYKPFLCSEFFSLHRKGFLKNAAPLEESIIMVSSLDTKTYFKKLNFCGKDVFQKSSSYCAVKYYSIKCHFSDQNYHKK